MTPYRLQNRQDGGVVIKQGKSWVVVNRDLIPDLINDLQNHYELKDPARVKEIDRIGNT
jgi:hypothetical protein